MDRAETLLRAAWTLLKRQDDCPYITNILAEKVYYDEAECDGSCLMEDIEIWFDENDLILK